MSAYPGPQLHGKHLAHLHGGGGAHVPRVQVPAGKVNIHLAKQKWRTCMQGLGMSDPESETGSVQGRAAGNRCRFAVARLAGKIHVVK